MATVTAMTLSGGRAITGYTVASSPSSITATGSSSPITVNAEHVSWVFDRDLEFFLGD